MLAMDGALEVQSDGKGMGAKAVLTLGAAPSVESVAA
jgi:hypothetical protein